MPETIQNLKEKYDNFLKFKENVKIWLDFHKNLKSSGVPLEIKQLINQNSESIILFKIKEIQDILAEYRESIDFVSYLHENQVFLAAVEEIKDEISSQMFNDAEQKLQQ